MGFASGGVTCKLGALYFYSSSVQVDSFVLRNPHEHQAREPLSVMARRMNNRSQTLNQTKKTTYFKQIIEK